MNTYKVTTRACDSMESSLEETLVQSDTFRSTGQNAEGVIFENLPETRNDFRFLAVAYFTNVESVVLVPTKKSKK